MTDFLSGQCDRSGQRGLKMAIRHKGRIVLALVATTALTASCTLFGGDQPTRQGWTEENRFDWYWATQGSRLMPFAWFDVLEVADGTGKFATIDQLKSYGFIAPPDGSGRTLPIGFAKDRQDDSKLSISKLRWYEGQKSGTKTAEEWIGLNCSACHTAEINVGGARSVIDGGPNLLDFQLFVEELDLALKATRANADKWERFNAAVLDGKDTPENRALLATAFDKLLAWQEKTDQMNETDMRYGFGRLDAVGHILNKVLMFTGAEVADGNPSDAPVSYPFVWDIWRQEQVQWNGVARNSRFEFPGDSFEYGALGRNTGEVLGVFGDVIPVTQTGFGQIKGYTSSVQAENLMDMELILQKLKAPRWPEAFPPIDMDAAARGKELFAESCVSCHLTPDVQKEGEKTEVMVTFQEMSNADLTDIWMACNAFTYMGPTGPLKGMEDPNGNVIGDEAPVAHMLATMVKATLLGEKTDLVKSAFRNFFGIKRRPVVIEGVIDPKDLAEQECLETEHELLAYKARPLDGIWATAPYLHNGSVSSLHEILLPAKDRKKQFWVGNRDFDPVKVGYVDKDPGGGKGFLLKTRDAAGRPIRGNENRGHEYGAAGFSDQDRQDLIEYMKTL